MDRSIERTFRNDDACDDDDDDAGNIRGIDVVAIVVVAIVVEIGFAANGVDDRRYRGWVQARRRGEEAVVAAGENE